MGKKVEKSASKDSEFPKTERKQNPTTKFQS